MYFLCSFSFLVFLLSKHTVPLNFTREQYDQTGWRTYRRPDEKSGGHGVGWSPIIPYTFSVPEDWEEVNKLLLLIYSIFLV